VATRRIHGRLGKPEAAVDFAFFPECFQTTYQLRRVRAMKVEFYYDSTVPCGSAFPCDNAKAVELIGQLAAKGVNAKAFDLKGEQVAFMTYNAAVTGPKSAVRAVFGATGALQEDFGKNVPALLVFGKDERYPEEAYPRSDRDLMRVLGCEEALQNLLAK
jgi:hypothetical protein